MISGSPQAMAQEQERGAHRPKFINFYEVKTSIRSGWDGSKILIDPSGCPEVTRMHRSLLIEPCSVALVDGADHRPGHG